MENEIRVLSWIVLPKGHPIFSETAIIIKIEDDAAGEFISIEQPGNEKPGPALQITKEEWPLLKEALDKAFESLNQENGALT